MSQENVEVVKVAYEAFARGGLDRWMPHFTDDVEWRAIEGDIDDVGPIRLGCRADASAGGLEGGDALAERPVPPDVARPLGHDRSRGCATRISVVSGGCSISRVPFLDPPGFGLRPTGKQQRSGDLLNGSPGQHRLPSPTSIHTNARRSAIRHELATSLALGVGSIPVPNTECP
jgi:hypothetical protein